MSDILVKTDFVVNETAVVIYYIVFAVFLILALIVLLQGSPVASGALFFISVAILCLAIWLHKRMLASPDYVEFKVERTIERERQRQIRKGQTYFQLLRRRKHEVDSLMTIRRRQEECPTDTTALADPSDKCDRITTLNLNTGSYVR